LWILRINWCRGPRFFPREVVLHACQLIEPLADDRVLGRAALLQSLFELAEALLDARDLLRAPLLLRVELPNERLAELRLQFLALRFGSFR
jgi:hypothetical protein